MRTAFRYNRVEAASVRPPRGYGRWLGFWLRALARLLRPGSPSVRLVWTADGAAETLAAGFPSLLAVPEELFADTAALFPEGLRLRAEGSEEEQLAAIRAIEKRAGVRFDWDAFLAACERRDRRAGRLFFLSEAIADRAPPRIDARTPRSALRSLLGKESQI